MSEGHLSGGDSPPAGFADGKADGALRTIGEVARALGIRQHVLRYWEEQFPMLKPLKRSGGRRYYRPEDVALVETIDRLVHREGFTLRGARQALGKARGTVSAEHHQAKVPPQPAEAATPPPAAATPPAGNTPNSNFAFRARLIALRTTLVKALHDS